MKLTIQPDTSVAGKITIYNKRRDKFSLYVGRGLIIKDIIFDSLDSILPYDKDFNGCLGRKENCCEMVDG